MNKKVVLQNYPTSDGLVQLVPNLTAKLNGQPIATQGSILTHKTLGGDAPAEFAPGIKLNGMPLTYVGAKTTGGATIMDGGMATAIIKGATVSKRKNSEPVEEEPSKTVELKSEYAMTQVRELAEQLAGSTFYMFMKIYFHGGIPISAFSGLYKAMSEKANLNPDIEVVALGLGKDAAWHKERKIIQVREKWVREAVEGAPNTTGEDKEISIQKAKSMVLEGILEEYGHYLDDLLRNTYSSVGEDTQGDEGALLKKYFLTNFDPFTDTQIHFATAIIDGVATDLVLDLSEFQKAFQNVASDFQDADKEYFASGEGDALMGHYGHLGIENILATRNILTKKELSHLYLGNYMRDMSQVIVPPFVHLNKSETAKLRQVNKDIAEPSWLDALKLSREGLTRIVELLAAGQMRKITQGEDPTEAVGGPGQKIVSPDTPDTLPNNEVKEIINASLQKLGVLGVQVSLDYWLFVKHYGGMTQEQLGVYRPEEHLDSPLGATVYDGLKQDIYYCADTEKPAIDAELGMKKHIRQHTLKQEEIGERNSTGVYAGGNLPTAAAYMEDQFKKFYDAHTLATSFDDVRLKNKALTHLGGALHVLEDFFAHTNFCELSLIKAGISVFPWVDLKDPELTEFSADDRFRVKNTIEKNRPADVDDTAVPFVSEAEIESYFLERGTFIKLENFLYQGFYFSHLPHEEANEQKARTYAASQKGTTFEVKLALSHKTLLKGGKDYAAQIPLVSGYFSRADSIHSLIHVLEEVFKPKPITFTGVLMENEGISGSDWEKVALDIADIIILHTLNDLSLTQQEEGKSGSETGVGMDYASLLEYYKEFIKYRAIAISIIAALKKKNPVVIIVSEILARLINTLYTQISNMVKEILTQCMELIASSITAVQNTELLRDIGTNPSHTQLAKDHGEHPLHNLAADFAMEAVSGIGELLLKLKRGIPMDNGHEVRASDLIAKAHSYMVHPSQSNWMEKITIQWVRSHGGKLTKLHALEKKRKQMAELGVQTKKTMAELQARYLEILEMAGELQTELQKSLQKLKNYIADLKSLASGLTQKLLKKYSNLMTALEKEYLVFAEKMNNKSKRLNGATEAAKRKLQEEMKRLTESFEQSMETYMEKASEVLKEAQKEVPSLFNSMEEDLKEFYNELVPKATSYKEINPENMLKYNILTYLEENEPEYAKRFQEVIDFEKGQLALTRKYVKTSAYSRLTQLDASDEPKHTALV
ncbi:MAG: HET-C-related protein [Pricia sp.]